MGSQQVRGLERKGRSVTKFNEEGDRRRLIWPARVWVGLAGIMFGIVGLIGIAIAVLPPVGPHDPQWLDLSQTSLIIGFVLVGQAVLSKHRVTFDEVLLLGKDLGYEKGFREGRRHPKPVVVELNHDERVENWRKKFEK